MSWHHLLQWLADPDPAEDAWASSALPPLPIERKPKTASLAWDEWLAQTAKIQAERAQRGGRR